jgi:hypothetical protein
VFDNRHPSTSPKAPTVGAAVPANNGDQVHKAVRQPDVGDVGAPHLVGADDIDTPGQIGINLVLRMGLAGVGAGRHARQAQFLHQAPHPLAVDRMAMGAQALGHAPRTIKRVPGVFFIQQ